MKKLFLTAVVFGVGVWFGVNFVANGKIDPYVQKAKEQVAVLVEKAKGFVSDSMKNDAKDEQKPQAQTEQEQKPQEQVEQDQKPQEQTETKTANKEYSYSFK